SSFFFSSRRRHTRSKRDWSSDVCSSDLVAEMNSVNRWAAYTESEIARGWIAAGVDGDEADRRAATMVATGAGGALVGAGIGAAIGAPIGLNVGLATGTMLLPVPILGQTFWITQGATGALIGAGSTAVPFGVAGAAVGATIGAGSPDQPIDQPWLHRDGTGEIVPLDNELEFDWNGPE